MEMNKKGLYFTLMTMFMLTLFLFYFRTGSYYKYREKMVVTENRINSLDNFIKSLERDATRGLYISSFRALISLEDYISAKGTFLDNFKERFIEALLNGTINNEKAELMEDSRFVDWINKISLEGEKLNLDVNITINNIDIYHKSPWSIIVEANLNLTVNDSLIDVYFKRNPIIRTEISIIGFEDPLYIVYGEGKVTNIIEKTPFKVFFEKKGDEFNVSNLMAHINNSYYSNNSDAPSFLMRFENNLGSSPFGIESFVNLEKFYERGIEIEERSCVDHLYFEGDDRDSFQITNMPSWFRLDDEHINAYGLQELKVS